MIAVAILGWIGVRWLTPYSGTVTQASTAAPSMEGLVRDDGTPVDVTQLGGELVLVYFGYTACPDVCTATMVAVDRALDEIGNDVDRVRVVPISIDPARDDAARVGEYVRSFDPAFRGVSGSADDVERVASTYGIYFARDEPLDGGGYTMSHTSTLLGIDPDGHLRIMATSGSSGRRCSTPRHSRRTSRSSCDPCPVGAADARGAGGGVR